MAAVTIVALGYLPRTQTAASQVWLWPATEPYVRALVYDPAFAPGGLLTRWTAPGFTVRPIVGLEAITEAAAGRAAAASGLAITASSSGAVEVVVDPSEVDRASLTAVAATARTFRGNVVVGCRIAYRDARRVTAANLLHEVGHCLGLGHSTTAGDLMLGREQSGVDDFSVAERVALRMMYRYREPGNAAPDLAP